MSRDIAYIRQKLKMAREDLGLSQQDMAQRYGVSQAKISNLESGRVQITIDDLIQFSKMTGKPLSFFFPPALLGGVVSDLDFDEHTLISLFREVSDQGFRDLILSFVREQVAAFKKAVELSRVDASQEEKVFRFLDSLLGSYDFDLASDGQLRILSGDAEVLLSLTKDLDKQMLSDYLRWKESKSSSVDDSS